LSRNGGKVTKFFHEVTNWKRRKTNLRRIHINGVCVNELNKIKEEIHKFSSVRFQERIKKLNLALVWFGKIMNWMMRFLSQNSKRRQSKNLYRNVKVLRVHMHMILTLNS